MSFKLKILGMGVLAAMAMGAVAVVNASATANGHFTSTQAHTVIVGSESATPHDLKFVSDSGSFITCTKATYSGTTDSETEQTIDVSPHYTECSTGGEAPHNITVHMNSCFYRLSSQGTRTHGTVSVLCNVPGDAIEITHPNCNITVPPQSPTATTMLGGLTYDTAGSGSTHELTPTVTVSNIHAEYHEKICVFLGTNHHFKMEGALTVKGTNTDGEQIAITST